MEEAIITLKLKVIQIDQNINMLSAVSDLNHDAEAKKRILAGLEQSKLQHETAIKILKSS